MARIFRHEYTATGPDGNRIKKRTRKWYIEYQGPDGKRKRVPGYIDKAATFQLAAKLEKAAERGETDLVDKYEVHRKRPLADHLADWKASLIAKGTTEKHAKLMHTRVTNLCNEARIKKWSDVGADRIQTQLANMLETGLSIQTANYYQQGIKQFCRWMVTEGRAPESPIRHLKARNVRTDRRHDRRAFTDSELSALLTSTNQSPARYGMTGPERALVYRLATETGLRAAELRSLRVQSFRLDKVPPIVVVDAAYSKRRRQDELPLRPKLVEALRSHLSNKLPNAEALRMPPSDKTAKMIRKDLDAAGIEYKDSEGRVADFHALRHTFITNLARSGVHPKVAQQLARHSTITLTMDRYSHTVLSDLSEAVAALPTIEPGQVAAETGTDSLGVFLGDETPKHKNSNQKILNKTTPGRIRTYDLRIRSPLLYPAELRALRCRNYTGHRDLAHSCVSTCIQNPP